MNRIEQALSLLQEKKEKALITYMTAGLPDLEGTKKLVAAQQEAGVDVIELGIPFSDPVADGPVIQNASYKSICQGTSLKKVFEMMEQARGGGITVPVIFMMYYNQILRFGLSEFASGCQKAGVDGLVVPDLPLEEQGELRKAFMGREDTVLIQLVTPVSKKRIPEILKGARGFVYCVSSMGAAGQERAFHNEAQKYLGDVKKIADIPVMAECGIRIPKDIGPMRDIIDGVIVESQFLTFLEDHDYSAEAAGQYCMELKRGMREF